MAILHLPISNVYVNDTRKFIKTEIIRDGYLGFDTETYDGAVKLIADSKGRYILDPSFIECINFLFYKANHSYYRSFWNIGFDISAIFKLWDSKYVNAIDDFIHGKEIVIDKEGDYKGTIESYFDMKEGKRISNLHDLNISELDYRLFYLKGKLFKINKGHKTVYNTDLFNIYNSSLNKASKIFLSDFKLDTIETARLNYDLDYWDNNLRDIIKYCVKDCDLTARLGTLLINTIKEAKLEVPRTLTSKASISKQYFRKNCWITKLEYIPINILDIAYQTYFGGRFEVLKRGYFPKLWSYDINSAYPTYIALLPSLKNGVWKITNEINKKMSIGFYNVVLDIPTSFVSALPHRVLPAKLIIFPSGDFGRWITWFEADLLRPYIKKIIKGYEYVPNDKEFYPFENAVNYLYEMKAQNKNINDILYDIYKICMNAIYGCFIERHKIQLINGNEAYNGGILFNPVYATHITGYARWKLLKEIKPKQFNKIVAFHTDSIISEIKLPQLKLDGKLGNWSIETKESGEKGVIIGTGMYQIGKKSRHRGFSRFYNNPYDKNKDIEMFKAWESGKDSSDYLKETDNPFNMNNDKNLFLAWSEGLKEGQKSLDWFKLLEKFGNKPKVKMPKKSVIKMAEALRRWHSIDKVNEFIDEYKKIDINSDNKRVWYDNFKNCDDLLSRNIESQTIRLTDYWILDLK